MATTSENLLSTYDGMRTVLLIQLYTRALIWTIARQWIGGGVELQGNEGGWVP